MPGRFQFAFACHTEMKQPEALDRYREDIVRELVAAMGRYDLPMYDMLRYQLGWSGECASTEYNGGKLVRPTLLLLACESVGGNWHRALPAAVAVELVHNFTLIHDDIEDEDEERRKQATVWWRWGKPQAINAGDAMHSLARLALLRLSETGIPPQKCLHAAEILDNTCLSLCEGQYLDISYEERLDISVEDYLEMSDRKTAALFAASLQIGALIGCDDDQVVSHFRRFGQRMGLAYQMMDDVFGIWGGETASDLRKRKKTLPVIYTLEHATLSDRDDLISIYTKNELDLQDIGHVTAILDRLDASGYARHLASEYYSHALEEIRGLDLMPSSIDLFNDIIAYLKIGAG